MQKNFRCQLLSLTAGTILCVLSNPVMAGACDYKPSRWFGGEVAAAVGTTAGTASAVGVTANALGYYTLVHATSGLTMLGSTAAGASAAGTVGIIGGSAGLGASILAVLTAPATIIAGAVTAVAVGGYEGACIFAVERVTDQVTVEAILREMAERADPAFFHLEAPYGNNELYLTVRSAEDPTDVHA